MTQIETGDIWLAILDPTVGQKQGGRRPVVVVSASAMHTLPINMTVVVPLTSNDRGLITQPRVFSETAGLRRPSVARPEDVRAIDASRLSRRLGRVSPEELANIRKVLRYFLDL